MWDQRYDTEEYLYGTTPNDFVAGHIEHIPVGEVLCIAGGEGRNAVWLAEQGRIVTLVDGSEVACQKARRLAAGRGVALTAIHADLAYFSVGRARWDAILSIFGHLPPSIRSAVHQRCVAGLRPGGVMVLEAYTPAQLGYETGGPPTADLMMSADVLRREFAGLEFQVLREVERDVIEGSGHTGYSAVVQMIARRPV